MSEPTAGRLQGRGRAGSLLISVFFVLAGVITLYDTTRYTDVDSMVFPRAAAVVLIVCSVLSIVGHWLAPSEAPGFGSGSWWRRFLLIMTMLLACLVMPVVGFLVAGCIAFLGGLIAAMHERWTIRSALIYAGSGMAVMVGFYALFRFALHVPLP